MDADLDTLCVAVYCTADDLLPEPPGNARRMVTDAEVVTLCVAQAIMGIPSGRRFLKIARKRLAHLFPRLPAQSGYFKRRRQLADTIEWLMSVFASQSPGYHDDLLLIDSTPVECARSRETVKRSQLADAAELRVLRVALPLLLGLPAPRDLRPGWHPTRARVGLAQARRARGRTRTARPLPTPRRRDTARRQGLRRPRVRPRRRRPRRDDRATPPKRRTQTGDPTSPRSGNGSSRSSRPAKTCSPSNATAPAPSTASKTASSNVLCLAACIALNHKLGRPSRALVDYVA